MPSSCGIHQQKIISMAFSGIQGHKLEITVVGCNQLKDTWYGRHKPYVTLMYGTSSHRTKTSRDGGKNPSFIEKFEFCLIEGINELSIHVNSSHNIMDSFIGHGEVNLEKVFREGYSATLVPLESLTGKRAGEVNLISHYYPNANVQQQQGANCSPYTQQYSASAGSSLYPPQSGSQPSYPPQGLPYPPQYGAHAQPSYVQQELPYPPQVGKQASYPPQGSPPYQPQHRVQVSQGPPSYPPQYKAQESQGPPLYPPQYQEPPAPLHSQPPRYTKQDLHDAKIRMMDAQTQRFAESADRMNGIGTNTRPVYTTTVHYTNRYEAGIDRMNLL